MNICEKSIELRDGTIAHVESVGSAARGKQVQNELVRTGLASANPVSRRLRWTCPCTSEHHATAGWDMNDGPGQPPQHFYVIHLPDRVEIFHGLCFETWDMLVDPFTSSRISGMWSPQVRAYRENVLA